MIIISIIYQKDFNNNRYNLIQLYILHFIVNNIRFKNLFNCKCFLELVIFYFISINIYLLF